MNIYEDHTTTTAMMLMTMTLIHWYGLACSDLVWGSGTESLGGGGISLPMCTWCMWSTYSSSHMLAGNYSSLFRTRRSIFRSKFKLNFTKNSFNNNNIPYQNRDEISDDDNLQNFSSMALGVVVDGGEDCWAVLYVQWVIGRKQTFVRSCPVYSCW